MAAIRKFDPHCPLCNLCDGDIKTRLYYEDDMVIVVDCLVHENSPIFVIKRHDSEATREELKKVEYLQKALFPERTFRSMHSILTHWHSHAE